MRTKNQELAKEALELYKKLGSSEKVAKELASRHGMEYTASLSRKIRVWVSDSKPKKIVSSKQFEDAKLKKVSKNSKYFIVTSAQNATKVNKEFFNNIKAYAKFLGASIEVIPIRYKNPTSIFQDKKHDWWDSELTPYLIANRHSLNSSITVLADVKTQPTASDPLTGMEGLTGVESSIIGHPRQHMKFLSTLDGYPKKVMFTTGSVTEQNYTDSKAGKKAEFHHTFGFTIVEIKNGTTFFARQVSAQKNGSFFDLDFFVNNEQVKVEKTAVAAMVLGDLHHGSHNLEAVHTTRDMLKRFSPKNIVLHDINDGNSINHHEKNNPFSQLQKEQLGTWSVRKEIDSMLDFINTLIEYKPVIVKSNHDDFFDRWLLSNDWRKENNKYEYLKYANLKANGFLPNGIIPYEIEKRFGKKAICLNENSTFRVRGVELGQHGHIGNSGMKGSPIQFSKQNIKMVVAHFHSPFKRDGLVGVGTLTNLRLGYNKGLSNWAHSNVIVHSNGKTQNLIIIDGEYTTINNKI